MTDSRGLETDSNSLVVEVIRETGPCANPLADSGDPDEDGDGVKDDCDNCPTVSNRSQRNTSPVNVLEIGLGNACRELPRLWVSSDPADNSDFSTIQQAVDGAVDSPGAVSIEILPGTGPYFENVVLDRGRSFYFFGRRVGSVVPVIEYAGSGNGIFELRSAGEDPIVIQNLVLRGQGVTAGQRGVTSDPGISTRLSDLRFEQLAYGLDLGDGEHRVQRIVANETVGTGVSLNDGVLNLSYAELRGVSLGLRMIGPDARAGTDHLLFEGNGTGDAIVNDSTLPGALALQHSTLVNWGTAVRGIPGNTTIAHSILWTNQLGISGVPCLDIAWSDVQNIACGGTNLSIDPLFGDPAAGNYHLQSTSPLLDHGPDPSSFEGLPCTDLDGSLRLRDHQGQGLARVDPGAYERENTSIGPPEVSGLSWTGQATLVWNPVPAAVEYHVYRGILSTLAYSDFGTCGNTLDVIRTDTTLTDAGTPPPGDGFYYLITVGDDVGDESTLGVGTCAERSNFIACP